MADERPRRARRERDEERPTKGKSRPAEKRSSRETRGSDGKRPRRRGLPGAKLAQHARQELAEITGLKAEGVSALEQQDDDTWLVTVELLELSRVPETDDVIGSYEAEFDENGELISYRRVRRFPRSQAGDEQAVRGG